MVPVGTNSGESELDALREGVTLSDTFSVKSVERSPLVNFHHNRQGD